MWPQEATAALQGCLFREAAPLDIQDHRPTGGHRKGHWLYQDTHRSGFLTVVQLKAVGYLVVPGAQKGRSFTSSPQHIKAFPQTASAQQDREKSQQAP